jgi:hypothetical protein
MKIVSVDLVRIFHRSEQAWSHRRFSLGVYSMAETKAIIIGAGATGLAVIPSTC